jgi:hypothetical protein
MTTDLGARLLAVLLAVGAAAASAQAVYRCGPEGREYSQVPCKDGRAVDVADPRSKTQQREAQQVAEDERRRTRQLEAERHQREAAAKPPVATGIKPLQTTEPPASAPRKKKDQQASKADPPVSTTARVPPAPKQPAR